MSYIKID